MIAALHQRIDATRTARETLPALEADTRLARERRRVPSRMLECTTCLRTSSRSRLRPSPSERSVASLAVIGATLEQDEAAARRSLDRATAKLEQAQAELAKLDGVAGSRLDAALASLLEQAAKLPIDSMSAQVAACEAELRLIDQRARALPRCDLDAAGIAVLKLPAPGSIDELVEQRAVIEGAIARRRTPAAAGRGARSRRAPPRWSG